MEAERDVVGRLGAGQLLEVARVEDRRNERPAAASSTTDRITPASSASAPGSRTKTGSPG